MFQENIYCAVTGGRRVRSIPFRHRSRRSGVLVSKLNRAVEGTGAALLEEDYIWRFKRSTQVRTFPVCRNGRAFFRAGNLPF